jgi:hypothetical protein
MDLLRRTPLWRRPTASSSSRVRSRSAEAAEDQVIHGDDERPGDGSLGIGSHGS